MIKKFIDRRDFLKITATCCVTTPYIATKSTDKSLKKSYSHISSIDSDFVIVNGWVLLKSDLAMS